MKWAKEFLPEANDDMKKLDGSVKKIVTKAIDRVSLNPLPAEEGGYGKPLANLRGVALAGFCKIKLKSCGLRVVYKVERTERSMRIVVIGLRADREVYETALIRIRRHGL